jgi:hypothetical protein
MTNAPGSKNFAQLMVPITSYYAACMREDVLDEGNCK